MERFLLVTSAGLSASLLIFLALGRSLGPRKDLKTRAPPQRYLALVLLQAAAYFLKDIFERSLGWVEVATFLIYADFLYGLPALFLYVKETFDEPEPRPFLHFIPAILNAVPALAMAAERVGSSGIDGALPNYLGAVPWLYINFLAACENVQLVVYGLSAIKLLRRHEAEPGAAEYRVVARLAILGYAAYYGVRWTGLALRIARSTRTSLSPAPDWIGPISTHILYLVVMLCGLYVFTHSAKFLVVREGMAPRSEGGKYGGKRLDADEAEAIVRRTAALLGSSEDLSDSSVSPRRLAQRLGVPYYLLSRIVNERCGMSIGAMIRDTRIARAKAMLEEDVDARILDIAIESGFSAKSSFNTAFKEAVGVSPTEYRHRTGSKR